MIKSGTKDLKCAFFERFCEKRLPKSEDLYYTESVVRKWFDDLRGEKMENQVLEGAVLQKVMKNIPLGLVVSKEGLKRKVYYVNQTAYDSMGYSKDEYVALVEKGWSYFTDVNLRKVICDNHEKIRKGEPFEVLAKTKTKSGEERWVLYQIVVRMKEGPLCYVSFMDVTEKIEIDRMHDKERKRLRELASRDSFTKLYNRGTMEQLVEDTLCGEEVSQCAYLTFDVDNFKQINDVYGHTMGDMLILEVSKQLKSVFNKKASVARMGGDEFAVFVKDVKEREEVCACAERVLAVLREQKEKLGLKSAPTLSIGIAFTPEAGMSFAELYRRADQAWRYFILL